MARGDLVGSTGEMEKAVPNLQREKGRGLKRTTSRPAACWWLFFEPGRSEKIARHFPAVRATMEPQRDCCIWCNRLLQRPRRRCEAWPGPSFNCFRYKYSFHHFAAPMFRYSPKVIRLHPASRIPQRKYQSRGNKCRCRL